MNSEQLKEQDAAGDNGPANINKTKLIINYIPQFTTEQELASIFSQVGLIENIRIVRDYHTGYSYGFGFVKYRHPDQAERAISTFNGLNLGNKRLKVSYSRPPSQGMKNSNLYITNLPKDVTDDDMDRIFGEFGEIIQRTVLKNKITGVPRGVGFVRFSKAEEALSAITALNGKQFQNSLLPLNIRIAEDHGKQRAYYLTRANYVCPFVNAGFGRDELTTSFRDVHTPRGNVMMQEGTEALINEFLIMNVEQLNEQDAAGDNIPISSNKTKLIINYLPQYTTEHELASIFSQVGFIENIRIMRDHRTGYSYGFGFVKYRNPEHAARAISLFNGLNIRNKRLKVSYSRPPSEDMKDSNLYITNLPKDITENEMDRIFGEFGEIIQRTLLKDKVSGMPRGVGFVRFSKSEEALTAITALNGRKLANTLLPLNIRIAADHGKQRAQYLARSNFVCPYANTGGYARQEVSFGNVNVSRGSDVMHGCSYTPIPTFHMPRYMGFGSGDSPFQNSVFW